MNRSVAPAFVAFVVLAAVVPAVVPASSPPQPLCSVCDDGFEQAAAGQYGLNATVTHSEVSVAVHEEGTGHWTVRNRLENRSVADRLGNDSDLLDGIVHTALGESYRKPHPDLVSNVSASVRGRTVVVTFAYEEFADRVGSGVLVVDYFHATDRENYGLVADRFTVVGPDGSHVVKRPSEGAAEETQVTVSRNETVTGQSAAAVTWVNRGDEDEYGVEAYVEETYVAFGPSDGLAQTAALEITLAERAFPTILDTLALLAPAGIALALGLGGYRAVVSAFFAARQATDIAGVVLAVGLLVVVHPFYVGSAPPINNDVPMLTAFGTAYVLVGGTALALHRFRERFRRVPWWWLLAPVVATPPVAALAVTILSYPDTIWAVPEQVFLAVPLVAVFALGYAVGGDDPQATRYATGVTLALLAALSLRFVSFTDSAGFAGLVTIIGTLLVVVGLLFGAPLYLLGGSLARAQARP